jgi:hypothetical protein
MIMMAHTLEPQIEESPLPGNFLAMAKSRPAKKEEVEEDADDDEVADDLDDSEEEDDSWDPDFEEFDLPKSKKGGGKKEADEEEDFKIEEDPEFKDLFGGSGRKGSSDFDDEDDDF